MIRILLSLGSCLLASSYGSAQRGCQLVDENGSPVPYAHVYLSTVQQGTLTDEEGRFELPWEELAPSTPIVFTCLNFEDLASTVGEVRAAGDAACTFTLRSRAYEIGGVEVRADRVNFATKKLGVPPPGRFSRTGYNFSSRGWELGVLIENEGRCRLRDLTLFVSNVKADSFHVEINLYDYNAGAIGDKLQSNRIFATITRADANASYAVPLFGEKLYIDGPFVASVTMLDDTKEVTTMLEASPKKKYEGYRHRLDGQWVPYELSPSISVVMECPEAR